MDYEMTIGLGGSSAIDSIRVIWPDDLTELVQNVSADQTKIFKHSAATEKYTPLKPESSKPLLQEVKNTSLLAHKENNYNDFDYEGLIYKLLSEEGPALAVGDIDGDGNEDVFIGGANGQAGASLQAFGQWKCTADATRSLCRMTWLMKILQRPFSMPTETEILI